jgi:hypothetical protein
MAATVQGRIDREYDRLAPRVEVGIAFIRDEVLRRDVEAQTERMMQMTAEVRSLTRWIAVLTVGNTVAVIAALWLELQ